MRVQKTVKADLQPALDATTLIPKLCSELGLQRNPRLVALLDQLPFSGDLLKWEYVARSYQRIYCLCPLCKLRKTKLYHADEWACATCMYLSKPSRRARRHGGIYARYLRPLRLLAEAESALWSDQLTAGRRRRLEKKVEKLKQAMPGFLWELRDTIYANSSVLNALLQSSPMYSWREMR